LLLQLGKSIADAFAQWRRQFPQPFTLQLQPLALLG
jgi:hypothetical protein